MHYYRFLRIKAAAAVISFSSATALEYIADGVCKLRDGFGESLYHYLRGDLLRPADSDKTITKPGGRDQKPIDTPAMTLSVVMRSYLNMLST